MSDRSRYLYIRSLSVAVIVTITPQLIIIETNINTRNTWHVKRRERIRVEMWSTDGWKRMKAWMREKTSSCLTQQHWPYFILWAVNQLEASEQTGREWVRGGGRDGERENKLGRKKGSGLVGRCRAIDSGLTVGGTDRDTDRCVVQFRQPFCLIYQLYYQPLSLVLPHIPFTRSQASYRRRNHSRQQNGGERERRNIIGIIALNMAETNTSQDDGGASCTLRTILPAVHIS